MSTKFVRISFAIAIGCTSLGCSKESTDAASAKPAVTAPVAVATTPDAAVKAIYQNMRNNNIAGLIDSVLPPSAVNKLKADWSKELNKNPISDTEKKEFADQMAKLMASDAESKLFAEIEPKLKEADQQMQQMPVMVPMFQGMIKSGVEQNKDITAEQKKLVGDIIDAMAKWALTAKFTDQALVKQAIGVVCKTARDLNIKTLDEIRALNYDQGMQKAGILLGGIKKLTEIYGLSFDKMIDSVKVEVVSTQADTAKVRVTSTLFDSQFVSESEMVKVDGKWFGKEVVEQLKKVEQEKSASSKEMPAADTTKETAASPSHG